jgi:uncharacterized Zn finger protein
MVTPPINPECPVCGKRVSRLYPEAKLENDLIIRKGDQKATLPVTIMHCTSCGNIMLFSTEKLPEDKFPS